MNYFSRLRLILYSHKHLIISVFACIFTLVIVNEFALSIYQHIWFPSSYNEPRNMFFLRGWEKYTSLSESDTADAPYKIVLISNSQGFLQEDADGQATYAYQLEQKLQKQLQQPIQVLNWSAPASNAAEQIILAARAIEHQPDLILWIVHNNNFVRAQFQPIQFYATDIGRLAYHRSVRYYLSNNFLRYHKLLDPLQCLNASTGLGKLIHIFERKRFLVWWWTPQVHPSTVKVRAWNDKADFYAREFYNTVRRGNSSVPIVFVSMPLNQQDFTDKQWTQMSALANHVKLALKDAEHIYIFDAINLLDSDYFYTSTHFDRNGHKKFADWLAEVLTQNIELTN